ncbi:MAG: class A beta-lactamase-related serine hydrolase [Polaribacter sp.]|nr:class A beta-lactamase-related serine hydrolase [Polaribacter sp.]
MRIIFLVLIMLATSCAKNNPIALALHTNDAKIKQVFDGIEKYEVQILFTEVLEKKDTIIFKDHSFQVDDSTYFYPARSVKFPIAVLALEKLNKNPLINRNTIFTIEGDSTRTTVANEIKKIFAVSDNEAYTRLFEYLGQDYITSELEKRGIVSRISHRFSGANPYSLETKSLHFYKNDSLIFSSESTKNDTLKPLQLKRITKGIGYTQGDSLIEKPMNFSLKNYMPISSLHNLMKLVQFPEIFPIEKRFEISKEDSAFLLNMMKILPKQANYISEEYYDSYVKFLVFGDTKEPIPNDIKIYNKVGYAYGYLTDCAFIENTKTNKKYIITATIHVNNNRVFNDGVYEYDNIGIPFLAALGRQLIGYK